MVDSLNAHLAVMRSPFSTATAAAKVPDGRTSASIASREAACSVHVQSATANAIIFVLQPCIAAGGAIYEASATASPNTGAATGSLTLARTIQYNPSNAALNTAEGLQARPDKFRIVSAGMRLSCVNSAQFNNGWFEAVRVPTDYTFPDSGSTMEFSTTGGSTVPDPALFESGIMISDKWCTHPSYVTGKLTDLYKHQFYLQTNNERDFKRSAGTDDASSLGYDTSFDIVLVRVFSTGGGTVPNAIHYHIVHHIEMMYDATNEKSRYHSFCHSSPALVTKVDSSIKKDPKASSIRSPNSFGVNPY